MEEIVYICDICKRRMKTKEKMERCLNYHKDTLTKVESIFEKMIINHQKTIDEISELDNRFHSMNRTSVGIALYLSKVFEVIFKNIGLPFSLKWGSVGGNDIGELLGEFQIEQEGSEPDEAINYIINFDDIKQKDSKSKRINDTMAFCSNVLAKYGGNISTSCFISFVKLKYLVCNLGLLQIQRDNLKESVEKMIIQELLKFLDEYQSFLFGVNLFIFFPEENFNMRFKVRFDSIRYKKNKTSLKALHNISNYAEDLIRYKMETYRFSSHLKSYDKEMREKIENRSKAYTLTDLDYLADESILDSLSNEEDELISQFKIIDIKISNLRKQMQGLREKLGYKSDRAKTKVKNDMMKELLENAPISESDKETILRPYIYY